MNIKKILFIIIAGISLTGCFYRKSGISQPEKTDSAVLPYSDGTGLTLDDVVRLSDKGYGLKWSDFDGYSYYETGCGLYIRVYRINEKFSLLIGGGGTYDNGLIACYFHLQADDGNFIDIRTDDVKEFIKKYS